MIKVLKAILVQGSKGDKGETGATGQKGEQGPKGDWRYRSYWRYWTGRADWGHRGLLALALLLKVRIILTRN